MTYDTGTSQGLKSFLIDVAISELAKPRLVKLPTMRELAKGAGVTPGAAYRHFKSQDELFLSVIDRLFSDLENAMDQAIDRNNSASEQIASMVQAYVKWGISYPGAYQLMFETTDDEKLLSSGQRPGINILVKLSNLFSGAGYSSHDSLLRVDRLWTSLHGLVSLRNHKLGMQWQVSIDDQIKNLLNSVL